MLEQELLGQIHEHGFVLEECIQHLVAEDFPCVLRFRTTWAVLCVPRRHDRTGDGLEVLPLRAVPLLERDIRLVTVGVVPAVDPQLVVPEPEDTLVMPRLILVPGLVRDRRLARLGWLRAGINRRGTLFIGAAAKHEAQVECYGGVLLESYCGHVGHGAGDWAANVFHVGGAMLVLAKRLDDRGDGGVVMQLRRYFRLQPVGDGVHTHDSISVVVVSAAGTSGLTCAVVS